MRNLLKTLAAIITVSVLFTSCQKDEYTDLPDKPYNNYEISTLISKFTQREYNWFETDHFFAYIQKSGQYNGYKEYPSDSTIHLNILNSSLFTTDNVIAVLNMANGMNIICNGSINADEYPFSDAEHADNMILHVTNDPILIDSVIVNTPISTRVPDSIIIIDSIVTVNDTNYQQTTKIYRDTVINEYRVFIFDITDNTPYYYHDTVVMNDSIDVDIYHNIMNYIYTYNSVVMMENVINDITFYSGDDLIGKMELFENEDILTMELIKQSFNFEKYYY